MVDQNVVKELLRDALFLDPTRGDHEKALAVGCETASRG